MKKSIFWVSFFFILQSVASLSAVDIDSLIESAKQESEILQMYTLNKKSGELSLQVGDATDTTGVTVSGGVGYQGSDTTSTSPIVERISGKVGLDVTLPNDQKTTINFSTGNINYYIADQDFLVSPTLGVSHTFITSDNGETLEDLQTGKNSLNIEYAYRVNESNFVSSIYSKISEIVNVEKSLISSEKDIITLQTIMDNTITLGTYTTDSVKYKSYELQMKNYNRMKQNYEKQLAILTKQFKQITNSEYSAIDMVEIPTLSFTPLAMGNTKVILSSLDVEIAKEQLALYNRRNVSGTAGSTVPSFNVSGDAGFNYDYTLTNSVDYSIGAGASYNGSSFALSSRVDLGIDSSGVTPALSVSGSWSNNANSKKIVIERASLENSVTIKELEYTQALLDYQISSQSLSSDVFNYENEVSEFNQSKEFNLSVLETQTQAYALGLSKESDVYSARVTIALDEKQEQLIALKGRVLAERIKSMQY